MNGERRTRVLELLKTKALALHDEQAAVTQRIREGFVERAIVSIDVVGSTQFRLTPRIS